MMPRLLALPLLLALVACAPEQRRDPSGAATPAAPEGKADHGAHAMGGVNHAAAQLVLYEVQPRSANACRTDLGAAWQREACEAKVAPSIPYRAEGETCNILSDLEQIKLGTLDDMIEDTDDFRAGITLRYIDERVGANAVWLMPIFPNNDRWNLPHPCDNLGSPYAVRDAMHVRGTLSRACIEEGRDEYASEPCWGDEALVELIEQAHARGMKVMLDVALNHFGHNYLMYDAAGFRPVRERIAASEDLDLLWDFDATVDPALVHPELVDSEEELAALVADDPSAAADLAGLLDRCPDLEGQRRVRAFHMWRVALDWERDQMPCDADALESAVPGFYLGADTWSPSTGLGDSFTNDWRDVKFLYHHETNVAHAHEYTRNREYFFRILNHWSALGVDGFRLDHTTDPNNGLAPNEWRYLLSKVAYYAELRGQARPIYLAEEFHDQQGMAKVVDIMTEGYVRDMCGRDGVTKDTAHIEGVVSNMARFSGETYVMTALETHDEHRLTDSTGFDRWTGAGFWGIGATTWSTPMLLMGQELGEPWGLGFRRSDLLRARFDGTVNQAEDADELLAFYGAMTRARLQHQNRALRASNHAFLRTRDEGRADARIFAQVKWTTDGNVVFVFQNLWRAHVKQSYFIDGALGGALAIRDDRDYRLVDALSEKPTGPCRSGADLKWDLPVEMDADTRLEWLRLELCD